MIEYVIVGIVCFIIGMVTETLRRGKSYPELEVIETVTPGWIRQTYSFATCMDVKYLRTGTPLTPEFLRSFWQWMNDQGVGKWEEEGFDCENLSIAFLMFTWLCNSEKTGVAVGIVGYRDPEIGGHCVNVLWPVEGVRYLDVNTGEIMETLPGPVMWMFV